MANKYFKAILFFAFFLVAQLAFARVLLLRHRHSQLMEEFWLICLGIGYAVKKIRDQSKN